ncbi:transposase [Nephila pilipes]|uniref:Transposase n=1 Tax=Nephila pilipes TaxID=299642 RepID=A0A8X6NKA9_NEPPI|nr:transposase [Nephila pilipes]
MWLKTGKLYARDTENSFATTGDNESDVRIKKLSAYSDSPIREKRKCNEEYIKFGFTWIGDENEPKGLCFECEHVMRNSSLNPSKLKRHLETKHPTLHDKSVEYS